MKHYKYILLMVIVALAVSSCGLDNYDAPKSKLMGKITYNGETLGLRGTGEAVQLQLYQDGYQLRDNIPVYVRQDGTFEALLFDGQYKLVTRNQNGPWINTRDTMIVNLKGLTEIEVKVTPYFTISNESVTMSGSTLNTTFTINQIVNDARIDYIMLLVNKTNFVDDVSNIARLDIRDQAPGQLNFTIDLSGNNNVSSATSLYGRVGVRTIGADQAIYSDVVKLR